MKTETLDSLRGMIAAKAAGLLRLPGVLAVEPGIRARGEKRTGEPTAVVTVERKLPPDRLRPGEDIRDLFGAAEVDVVEAGPLQALFARPDRYGVTPAALAYVEDLFGYPFTADAVGVQPTREMFDRRETAVEGITYRPPEGVRLEPVRGRIKFRCHAGPDTGWHELRRFLEATRSELVVGMYELTAPHVGDLLTAHLGGRSAAFRLVLDDGEKIGSGVKEDDRTEEEHVRMFRGALGGDFTWANAHTGRDGGTFATDYHIKLAVRDREAFWLSSGSWQSSNQPPLDPLGADAENPDVQLYNREWHVIGEHAGLAELWARFLEWDLETAQDARRSRRFRGDRPPALPDVFADERAAERRFPYRRFFPPRDFTFEAGREGQVLPLLTPDNYIEAVTALARGAETELLVQNQSLGFRANESDQDPGTPN